jgi:hypothetical protein
MGVAPAMAAVRFEAPYVPTVTGPPICLVAGEQCVQVDVFRDTANGNPLPTFFGNAFGIRSQNVRATATAHAANANHTNCLKPFLIPDKFTDVDMNGIYNAGDIYNPPGYTLMDIGTILTLRAGDPKDAAAPSTYYSDGDANVYRDNIVMCNLEASPTDIVDMLPGRKEGPTSSALTELLANGPVTLAIGMFSPVVWEMSRQTGRFPMTIYNIMGFCVRPEDQNGSGIVGRICALPGDFDPGGPIAPAGSTFLKMIQLIR